MVAVLSAQGAGLYGVTEIRAPVDAELVISHLLNPNAAEAALVVSSSPIITANPAIVAPQAFIPAGYTLGSVVRKGTTTVAPLTDAFRYSFDIVLDLPITLRAGEYLGLVKTTDNSQSSSGIIGSEVARQT